MTRGVVIVAGGQLAARGVSTASQLRAAGCGLPIEFWHIAGETPVSSNFGTARDGGARHNGWALKPYAVKNSTFDEILLLDAGLGIDADPTPLFSIPAYQTGALFWHDSLAIRAGAPIWAALGLEPRVIQSLDSGQVVIDRRKNAASLDKVVQMNEQADKFHSLLYGDKDTWLFGWMTTGGSCAVCPHEPQGNADGSWRQLDWDGRPMFRHSPSFSAGGFSKPGLSGGTYKVTGAALRSYPDGLARPQAGGVR